MLLLLLNVDVIGIGSIVVYLRFQFQQALIQYAAYYWKLMIVL